MLRLLLSGLLITSWANGEGYIDRLVKRWTQSDASRSGTLGGSCSANTDCVQSTMYCNHGVCACLTSYIALDDHCYEKANPGESCQLTAQCQSAWPESRCVNNICICNVGSPSSTNFGCIAYNNYCPLPADSGGSTPLLDTSGNVVTCTNLGQPCSGNEEFYECMAATGSTSGVCCPNQEYTCMLPKATSVGSVSGVNRWYFNSRTRSCIMFTWYSDGLTNANNFATKTQCESNCLYECPRGAAERDSSGTKKTCYSSSSSCGSGYTCTSVNSKYLCCQDTSDICTGSTPSTGVQCSTVNDFRCTQQTRYYYNSDTGKCTAFTWYGQAGSYNNFMDKSECEEYCEKASCSYGSPLRNTDQSIISCSSSASCPDNYICSSSVCCPREQTICEEPMIVGYGSWAVSRYWYNSQTHECQGFTYSGAGGNDNNFETSTECYETCTGMAGKPSCPHGQPYVTSSGTYLTGCTPNSAGTYTYTYSQFSCPSNYYCYADGSGSTGCCPIKG